MITDIQKASLLKRISAAILDFILLSIVSVGFMYVTSIISNYDKHSDLLQAKYDYYSETYGVRFDISTDEYSKLSEEEIAQYNSVQEMINNDGEFIKEYNLVVGLSEVIVTVGLLIGVLFVEFLFPIFFKNGQTPGKKIFGLAVVKQNAVKLTNLQLFVRSILGKYTLELMLPIAVLVLIYFNVLGGIVLIALILFCVLQFILYFFTRYKTPIHDLLAYTVVVDINSQMIFESDAALLNYKEENHLEYVNSLRS